MSSRVYSLPSTWSAAIGLPIKDGPICLTNTQTVEIHQHWSRVVIVLPTLMSLTRTYTWWEGYPLGSELSWRSLQSVWLACQAPKPSVCPTGCSDCSENGDPWILPFLKWEVLSIGSPSSPPVWTILILEGNYSTGGGLLNTGKAYHWNGKIACPRVVEIHAIWGKLEQICLEAGRWPMASGMLTMMRLVPLSVSKCAWPGDSCLCSLGSTPPSSREDVCLHESIIIFPLPAVAAVSLRAPLQSLCWEMYHTAQYAPHKNTVSGPASGQHSNDSNLVVFLEGPLRKQSWEDRTEIFGVIRSLVCRNLLNHWVRKDLVLKSYIRPDWVCSVSMLSMSSQ